MNTPRRLLRWSLEEVLLARNSMSHTRLAALLKEDGAHPLSRSHVSRLARGTSVSMLPLVDALCRVLDCSPNELFGWEGSDRVERYPLQRALREHLRDQTATGSVPSSAQLPEGAMALNDKQRAQVVGPRAKALPAHPLARGGKRG